MLLKKSVFFSVVLLLISIFSVYPSSEKPPSPGDRPSPSHFPTEDERVRLVKSLLSSFEKLSTQDLIKNIVELTDRHSVVQVTKLMVDIISASEKDVLEQAICLEKLKIVINQTDPDQMKQQKLKRIKEIIYRPKPLSIKPDWISEEDLEPTHDLSAVFPTDDERLKIVKEILHVHNKSPSESLVRKIVEQTSGLDESSCRSCVTAIVEISKSSAFNQERYLERPTPDERRGAVEEVLLLAEKSAPESLIEDIVELTDHYNIHTLRKLVRSMAKKSKTNSLDRNSCIEKLRKVIDLLDEGKVRKFKFARIEAMTSRKSLPNIDEQQKVINNFI